MAFTFFFRDLPLLESAANLLVQETMGRSRVRVWDAGCAMGPEPYTLLILLAERMGNFAFKNLSVDATDIDEGGDFGQIIEKGHYPLEQVQRIPSELFAKYLKPVDASATHFEISAKLRERIRFRRNDLLKLDPPGEGYALIVCKNVLLHFSPEKRVEVIRMFHRCLAEGGLFLTENTQKIPQECAQLLVPASSSDARVYRKGKESLAQAA